MEPTHTAHDAHELPPSPFLEESLAPLSASVIPPLVLGQPALASTLLVLLCTIVFGIYVRLLPPAERILNPLRNLVAAAVPARVLATLESSSLRPARFFRLPVKPIFRTILAAKSAAMARLLGIPQQPASGGIMAQVTHAAKGLASGLPTLKPYDRSFPAGLGNRDNSCFQNSVLQGLSALESLPAYLGASHVPDEDEVAASADDNTAVVLRDFVAALRDPGNNGRVLWTPSRLRSLNTWQQQDAQEYFSKLLEEVDTEMAKTARRTVVSRDRGLAWSLPGGVLFRHVWQQQQQQKQHVPDGVALSAARTVSVARTFQNPLEGMLTQRVVCTRCGHTDGLSMIPFNFLTVNLPVWREGCHLEECLDAYTRIEEIEGVECPKCTLLKAQDLLEMLVERVRGAAGGTAAPEALAETLSRLDAARAVLDDDNYDDWPGIKARCKLAPRHRISSTKTKQTVIARPPQSIVFHVNRSVFDETTGKMHKNSTSLTFDSRINLAPWCMGRPRHASDRDAESVLSAVTATEETTCPAADEAMSAAEAEDDPEEQWATDPYALMNDNRAHAAAPGNSAHIYELRAVITHAGRHDDGHYVCYKRVTSEADWPREGGPGGDDAGSANRRPITPPSQKHEWWRLSDETITRISEEEMAIRAEAGVFMLFYERVPPAPWEAAAPLSEVDPYDREKQMARNPLTPPRDAPSSPPLTPPRVIADRARQRADLPLAYPPTPSSVGLADMGMVGDHGSRTRSPSDDAPSFSDEENSANGSAAGPRGDVETPSSGNGSSVACDVPKDDAGRQRMRLVENGIQEGMAGLAEDGPASAA